MRHLLLPALTLLCLLVQIRPAASQSRRLTDLPVLKLDSLTQVLQRCEQNHDSMAMASCLRGIGMVYFHAGQYENSLPHFERRAAVQKALRDTAEMGYAELELGQSYRYLGKYMRAQEHYRRSLALQRSIGNRDGIAWALHQLTAPFVTEGREQPHALEYIEEAIQLWEDLGYQKEIRMARIDRAHVLHALGRLTEAMEQYLQLIETHRQIGDMKSVASLEYDLGRVYMKLKRWRKAEEYLRGSLKRYENLNPLPDVCAGISSCLGHVLSAEGKHADALRSYEYTAEIYRRTGNEREYSRNRTNIGSAYRALNRHREAIEMFSKAAAADRARGDLWWAACNYNQIAITLKEMGLIDSAITYGEESCALLQEDPDDCTYSGALNTLSELYAQAGDYQSAHRLLKKSIALKDSTANAQNLAALHEMAAKYDAEKNQQQIALLKKDREIQALRLDQQGRELDERRMHDAMESLKQQELRMRASKLEQDSALMAAKVAKGKLLLGALLIGFILLVIIAVLLMRRARAKRREVALRAEAAEFKAQAAATESHRLAAETNRLAAENERREKDAQRLLTWRLLLAQERERERIAGDLHDSLGQELVVIKNRAIMALRNLNNPERLKTQLQHVEQLSGSVMQSIRSIAHNLRPLELDRLGLTASLRGVVKDIEDSTPLRVHEDIDSIDGMFDRESEIMMYRLVQEALGNIVRHARATHVHMRAGRIEDRVHLDITDDGIGFEYHDMDENGGSGRRGLGLRGMSERVRILGGRMEIHSAPGEGTRIHIEIPVSPTAEIIVSEVEAVPTSETGDVSRTATARRQDAARRSAQEHTSD